MAVTYVRIGGVMVPIATVPSNMMTTDTNQTITGTKTHNNELTAPDFKATGLTGATAASRYAGATTSGAPASGTFQKGDCVVAQDGHLWICTTAGSPGTWVDAGSVGNQVTSVAGRTGAVVLTAADIGAGTFPAGTFTVGTVNHTTDSQVGGVSLPRGRVASGQITSNFTGSATPNTEVMVTGVAATYTFVTGRRYKAWVNFRFQNVAATAGNGASNIRWAAGTSVTTAGTALTGWQQYFPAAVNAINMVSYCVEFTCVASGATGNQVNAGQNTLGASCQAPAALPVVIAAAGSPAQIVIEDISV